MLYGTELLLSPEGDIPLEEGDGEPVILTPYLPLEACRLAASLEERCEKGGAPAGAEGVTPPNQYNSPSPT